MKRTITAWELVQQYKADYGTLPTVGVELQELRYFADAHGYEMPDADDVQSVVQQLRTWTQPVSGQPGLFDN